MKSNITLIEEPEFKIKFNLARSIMGKPAIYLQTNALIWRGYIESNGVVSLDPTFYTSIKATVKTIKRFKKRYYKSCTQMKSSHF